jgi:hypothetical protein
MHHFGTKLAYCASFERGQPGVVALGSYAEAARRACLLCMELGSGFRSADLCCHNLWLFLLVRFTDLFALRFARRHHFSLNKLDKVRASISSTIDVFEFRIEEFRIAKDSV